MNRFLSSAGVLALCTGTAMAGGIERAVLNYGILYEEGSRAEIGFSTVSPTVSGTYVAGLGGGSTGDMAGSYQTFSFAYKQDLNDKLSFGIFVNTPYGADANYTAGPYTGLQATWDSKQIAGVMRYEITPAVSLLGGLRYVRSSADINIPPALLGFNYTASGTTGDLGYVVGAAYEKPEIALRVALTYESAIKHSFPTVETGAPFGPAGIDTTTEVEMPQSITLDFQSGVAKDTLIFGSIRWAEWSAWEVRPPGFGGFTGQAITSFQDDVLTYRLGVGRKLSDSLSVFARIGYEKANGGVSSRLSPTDGSKSVGIGGSYTVDNMKVTGGVEYVELGDAVDGSGTVFEGSKAVGVGVSVAFSF